LRYPNVSDFRFNATAGIFGVKPYDPGWIYLVEHDGRYKIGKTTNPSRRFREAKTWIPDINIIGVKPFWNISYLERALHIACVWHWESNEWHKFFDAESEELILSEFKAFSDEDINTNSVNFIYFMNGSGLSEFTLEFSSRNISLKQWRDEETGR